MIGRLPFDAPLNAPRDFVLPLRRVLPAGAQDLLNRLQLVNVADVELFLGEFIAPRTEVSSRITHDIAP